MVPINKTDGTVENQPFLIVSGGIKDSVVGVYHEVYDISAIVMLLK